MEKEVYNLCDICNKEKGTIKVVSELYHEPHFICSLCFELITRVREQGFIRITKQESTRISNRIKR